MRKIRGDSLINALSNVPKNERYSNNLQSLVDHVLVDKRLFIRDAKVFTNIFKDSDEFVSDHYPVMTQIDLLKIDDVGLKGNGSEGILRRGRKSKK